MGTWTRYSSTFPGCPTLSGTAGDLTTILDAVLVNGTTTQSVSSITRSGSTATLTCAAHGVPVGDIVPRTVSGAVETEYNGTYLMTSASSTTFTYTVSGTPATPATGTILYNIPPAGWSIAFTATNKRAYFMGAAAVARKYMRVHDNATGTGGAKEALVRGFNTMSTVDAGTGPFPTNAQSALTDNSQIIRKSNTADATTRAYEIWADDKTIIIIIVTGDSGAIKFALYFGEYESSSIGDTTACMIAARTAENTTAFTSNSAFLQDASSIATGSGSSTGQKFTCGDAAGANISTACWCSPGQFVTGATTISNGLIPYPNTLDGGLYLQPLFLFRNNGAALPQPFGKMRGVMFSSHPASTFTDADSFAGVGDVAGRNFLVKTPIGNVGNNTQQIFIENGTNPPASI